MTDNRSLSAPTLATSFTIEHMKELDFLKTYGSVSPLTANEEQILDDIAAAGFARKDGPAYVYLSVTDKYRDNRQTEQSDAVRMAERPENSHMMSGPILKAPERVDDAAVAPPIPPVAAYPNLEGIAGWLAFFSLSLVFSPVFMAWSVFQNVMLLAGHPAPDLATALAIENFLLIAIIIFQIFVAVNFFQCRSTAPKLVIALLVTQGLFTLIDLVLCTSVLKASLDASGIVRSLVYVGVWIPYFLMSKRVKATFVRGGTMSTDADSLPRYVNPVPTVIRPEAKNKCTGFSPDKGARAHADERLLSNPLSAGPRAGNTPKLHPDPHRRQLSWSAKFAIFVAAFIAILTALWIAGGNPSETTIFAQSSPAVVQVVVQDRQGKTVSSGSGFLVSRGGLFATNYHVIEKAHSRHVVLADNTKLTVVGVTSLDKEADLAIVKVAEHLVARPLELAGPDVPSVGTKVFAIGNPLGLANSMSDGLVSGIRKVGQIAMIQTSAPISVGSSGGPLLGPDGKVVGVTTFLFKEGQNLNFAVPASCVASLLHRAKGEGQENQMPLVRRLDAIACTDRGQALLAKGKYDEAIEEYDKAAPIRSRKHTGSRQAWYLLVGQVGLRPRDQGL